MEMLAYLLIFLGWVGILWLVIQPFKKDTWRIRRSDYRPLYRGKRFGGDR